MDWAEELFTLKRSAKKGRRAAAAAAAASESTNEVSSNSGSSATRDPINKDKPNSGSSITALTNSFDEDLDLNVVPKPKKTGGWADEPIKSGKHKAGTISNIIEQERFQPLAIDSMRSQLSDDDIPNIPEIEDLQDDELINEMAEAPEVAVNRAATYNELNSDLLKQGAFATLEDIDLSILTRCLLSERELVEPDEEWTWDQLFTEVSGEIHADKPKSADAGSQQQQHTTTEFIH